jgi:NAD-dependent deacetylase
MPLVRFYMVRQNIVFVTGAGISADSGIPTFRGDNGLWQDKSLQYRASIECFEEDTEASLLLYNAMREKIYHARPNHAHDVIAALEKQHDVTVITQNVDDLHERAGSTHVIHMHGELAKVTSSVKRLDPNCIKAYPLNVPIHVGDKAADGSQLRPAVVMFNEYTSNADSIRNAILYADIFCIIGTSFTVSPASSFTSYARNDIPRFVINPSDLTGKLPEGYKHIKMRAVDGIDVFLSELDSLVY